MRPELEARIKRCIATGEWCCLTAEEIVEVRAEVPVKKPSYDDLLYPGAIGNLLSVPLIEMPPYE
jgi:hypothetical protein